jgi:hypothetical protein
MPIGTSATMVRAVAGQQIVRVQPEGLVTADALLCNDPAGNTLEFQPCTL